MAKNKISDLRDHLFETLEALKDADKPMDIERARTISAVAQTIINVAKVEVDMVKAVGGDAPTDGFFQLPPGEDRDVAKHARRIDERQQQKQIGESKKAV
jgi:hypothetical protein